MKYTDTQGNTLQYAYDEVGNLVTLTYPDSKQVHYEYDATDQLIKVTDWAGRATQYSYDANGRLVQVVWPNGTQMTRTYDIAGQLLQQQDVANNGELISQFDYVYDAAGDITEEQSLSEPDPFFLQPINMTYTAANRLATFNGEPVSFDADGNMTQGPLNGEKVDFVFDSRNRLVSVGVMAYRYDAENQRIAVKVADKETRYVINSQPVLSQVLVKTAPDGQQTYYVYGLGLIGQETNGDYQAYHFDLRGSTVALSDESGNVVDRFQYSPYAGLMSHSPIMVDTPFLYNGRDGVMTDDTGLYYMRARYYNPEIRRFVNQDVLLGDIAEGQTLNRYAYVTGQVISFIDPEGYGKVKVILDFFKFSNKGKNHVNKRHVNRHHPSFLAKSKFKKHKQIDKNIKKTLKKPDRKTTQNDGRIVYEKDFHREIGTRGETIMRVVLEKNGKVVTAFPSRYFKIKEFKMLGASAGIYILGDNIVGNTVNFFNPLSDIEDIVNYCF